MVVLYRILLWLYRTGIRLAALRSAKARQWVDGRRGQISALRAWRATSSGPLLWMHCASLGEFEQGRPLLEAWRQRYPDYRILLTFFSPSGYTVRQNYPEADRVAYLPLDGKKRAAAFLGAVQPALAIFVKYEFWYFYLTGLRQRKITTLLIAATFRPRQPFFRWYGTLHRRMLTCFDQLFVQDKQSREILAEYELPVTVAGDPRIDRVTALPETAPRNPLIERFVGNHPVLIAGSVWPADLTLLSGVAVDKRYADWRFIVAPHEVHHFRGADGRFRRPAFVDQHFPGGAAFYSQRDITASTRVLLIDNIGLLNQLYRYATVVYIGGGFGAGIHNTLEPMAFGKPVLFGGRFDRFPEAVYLDGFPATGKVVNAADLKRKLDYLLEDEAVYAQARERALAYLSAHAGATDRILSWLHQRTAS